MLARFSQLTGNAGGSATLTHPGNTLDSLLGFNTGTGLALVDSTGGLTVDNPPLPRLCNCPYRTVMILDPPGGLPTSACASPGRGRSKYNPTAPRTTNCCLPVTS